MEDDFEEIRNLMDDDLALSYILFEDMEHEQNKGKEGERCLTNVVILLLPGLPGGDEGLGEPGRRASWIAPRINHQVLTPFLNRINNSIEGEHSTQPALSLVANRPFEQWTDMDVERFPGLADGIGDLFQQAWQNYGDSGSDLTTKELEQKKQLRKEIKPHLDQISKNHSQKALAAALRELLTEIEKEY